MLFSKSLLKYKLNTDKIVLMYTKTNKENLGNKPYFLVRQLSNTKNNFVSKKNTNPVNIKINKNKYISYSNLPKLPNGQNNQELKTVNKNLFKSVTNLLNKDHQKIFDILNNKSQQNNGTVTVGLDLNYLDSKIKNSAMDLQLSELNLKKSNLKNRNTRPVPTGGCGAGLINNYNLLFNYINSITEFNTTIQDSNNTNNSFFFNKLNRYGKLSNLNLKNLDKLLNNLFNKFLILIGKPLFEITPDKIVVNISYYFLSLSYNTKKKLGLILNNSFYIKNLKNKKSKKNIGIKTQELNFYK